MAVLTPAEEYRAAAETIRSRVDLFGKALAALATLATSVVGLTEVGDLFPVTGSWFWWWAAVVGVFVAALAAVTIAARLMAAGNPNEVQVDSIETLIQPVFAAAAGRFGFKRIEALQEHERGLRAAAARAVDDDERARRTALAEEIAVEIDTALARAQLLKNREDAASAVSDWKAWLLYAAVLTGLLFFALGTDAVTSNRTDRVAAAKACGEARGAKATPNELGRAEGVCDKAPEPPAEAPSPPTQAQARADIAAQLTDVLKACTALVPDGGSTKAKPLRTADCAPIRAVLPAVLGDR
jgi:hypothetical protein